MPTAQFSLKHLLLLLMSGSTLVQAHPAAACVPPKAKAMSAVCDSAAVRHHIKDHHGNNVKANPVVPAAVAAVIPVQAIPAVTAEPSVTPDDRSNSGSSDNFGSAFGFAADTIGTVNFGCC